MKVRLPYGKGNLSFSISRRRLLGILQKRRSFHKNERRLLEVSLSGDCLDGLTDSLKGKKNSLIVLPDSTRNAHQRWALSILLKKAYRGNVTPDIVIATGLHRPETRARVKALLGETIAKRYRIISHDPRRDSVLLGRTDRGIPLLVNRILRSYEHIVSIGVIEPHLYAGYSGGAKTCAIGLGGEGLINGTHHPRLLDHPGTAIGNISGNPFQGVLRQIVKRAPIDFCINFVNDPEGRLIKVFSGPPEEVFSRGVAFARKVYEITVARRSDIVICAVGYPKDINVYQASRAINYIVNVKNPILKKGGCLILVAALSDGMGSGIGEKRFAKALLNMKSPEAYIGKIKRSGCRAGEHRAYMVAKGMRESKIILVTRNSSPFVGSLPFPVYRRVENAILYADAMLKKEGSCYIVPHALSTIARCAR